MITRNHSTAVIFAAVVLSSAILLDAVPMFAQAQSIAASEAATSIAKAKLEAATAAQNAGKKKYPVTRDDMVVAMPVDQAHLTVAHASRVWRKVLQLSLLFPVCGSGCIAVATTCMDSHATHVATLMLPFFCRLSHCAAEGVLEFHHMQSVSCLLQSR